MQTKIILDLCSGSGAWSKPYQENDDYSVICVTLPDCDVRTYVPPEDVYGILAAPPCTEFSMAKNFHGTKVKRDFAAGLAIVDACLRIIWRTNPQWWALENPKGLLRWWLGKPKLTFDPCDYGDKYLKKTDLWGCFCLPKQNPIEPDKRIKFSLLKSREIHPEYYGKLTRTERRAITPPCFAQAFFESNR